MSTIDWIVLAVVLLAALVGFSRGLVRGAFSLAGFALGAYVGARLAPGILSDGSPYVPLVALAGAILGGALLQTLAELLAGSIRASMRAVPGLRSVDSIAGLVLGAAAGVFLCWAVGAVLLYVPGQSSLRKAVQESAILSRINDEFPPERLLETLERVDPYGVLLGPEATVPEPDSKLARDPDVRRAAESVVRVTGFACGLGVEGSGWIVRPELVVTNAHVVAGVERPRVDRRDGELHAATVVAFDVRNDLAVLRAPGLDGRPLSLADPERGVGVVLLGYPENGPLTKSAGRLGKTVKAFSRDAYGSGPVARTLTTIRGTVRPGNSGGPGVDARGRVRTTVFARRAGEDGGYGIPTDLVRAALAEAGTQQVPAAAPQADVGCACARVEKPLLHMVGDDDPRHLVVQPQGELVAPHVEDADEQRNRGRSAQSFQEPVEVFEVEEDLCHGEASAGLDLAVEAVELQLEVVRGRVHGDPEEERRRRVYLASVEVLACVHVADHSREPDRVDLVDALGARVVAGLGRIAGYGEYVPDPLRMRAEQRRLETGDREIAWSEVGNRLDAGEPLDRRGRHHPAHACPRAGVVVHVDDVHDTRGLQIAGELEHRLRVPSARRVDL